jgi:hypothetical protein
VAHIIWYGSARPHHPLFGLHHVHIASRLTEENWQEKAIVRLLNGKPVYLWIVQDQSTPDFTEQAGRFWVLGKGEGADSCESSFLTLQEALAYINGEGEAPLGETPVATPEQYPAERNREVYVSSIPVRRSQQGGNR